MKQFETIITKMAAQYKIMECRSNIQTVLYIVTELNLVDFFFNGNIENSRPTVFTFFTRAGFLQLSWKEVVDFMRMIEHIVVNVANSDNTLEFNKENFVKKVLVEYELMEQMFCTNHQFNKYLDGDNLYMKFIYGYQLIQLMIQARIYTKIIEFRQKKFDVVLK